MSALQSAAHRLTPTKQSAKPAEPLIASALVSAPLLHDLLEASVGVDEASPAPPQVLKSGLPSLDDALGSVLQSGSVVALSSEKGDLRCAVAKTLLVDCLVANSESAVAVVDTTGNFDVVGLYKLILARLEKEPGGVGEMEELAARVLDRVQIMRVFDFVGMREAVGELRDGLEGRTAKVDTDGALEEMETVVRGSIVEAEEVTEKTPSPQPKKTEIADSEDEDEDEDLEASDEEMLFDTPVPAAHSVLNPPAKPPQQSPPSSAPHPTLKLKLKLILIDNLSHVLTPILKRDTTSATTLATNFITTLVNLTRTHSLHTILLNPCTTPHAPSPTRKPADTAPQGPQQAYTPRPPPAPSIFSSNAVVPALLGLLSRYADAHVLVSVLPRRKMDAGVYYGDTGGRERGKRRGVEMVGVLEVVADRWGGRVGAWGIFREGREGMGVEGV